MSIRSQQNIPLQVFTSCLLVLLKCFKEYSNNFCSASIALVVTNTKGEQGTFQPQLITANYTWSAAALVTPVCIVTCYEVAARGLCNTLIDIVAARRTCKVRRTDTLEGVWTIATGAAISAGLRQTLIHFL